MTLFFRDVSHYQGDYHPTGPTIAKATEGDSFVDERYATTKARTLAGGWPFAGYHFLATEDPRKQAAHAINVIGHTPAMLDFETMATGGKPTFQQSLDFIDCYQNAGGILHLVYLPHWYWLQIGAPSLKPLVDRGVALISSTYAGYIDDATQYHYTTGPHAGELTGWAPYGGMVPSIWQFTATPIDTNAFHGSVAELGALMQTGDTTVALAPEDLVAIANKVWTYKPGWTGLLDETPLGMLNDLRVVRDQLVAGAHSVDEIAAAVVAALPPSTGGTPAPISDADVTRITKSVLDGFAARQAE